MVLRLAQRDAWHSAGLLLWLLPRSHLRSLPIPYPLIMSFLDYLMQLPYGRPEISPGVLMELIRLRTQLGVKRAFIEEIVKYLQ